MRDGPLLNRRDFLKGSLAGAGSLLVGTGITFAAPLNDAAVRAVDLTIRSVTEILHPPKRGPVRVWVPLPVSDPEQEISGLSVESAIPFEATSDSATGNRMITLSADSVKPGEFVTLKYRLRRRAEGVIELKDDPPSRYLKPSEWEKWDDAITGFVDRIAGNETDPVRAAGTIYRALIERIGYIHEVCGRGVAGLSFEQKLGRCDEFHALFRSMLMYKGIPVKWEQGMALPYPSQIQKTGEFEADCINAHSWVRFHAGGGRWFPADLSEGKRRPDLREYYFGHLVPNRIKMSEGRGRTLNPSQEGIINTFAYAYAEAGGIPIIYGHNYKNVIRYELLDMEG